MTARVDTRSFVPALSLALLKVRHETLSIFLSPVCIELTRWMRVFAVITLILIVLTVDVWRELSLSPTPHCGTTDDPFIKARHPSLLPGSITVSHSTVAKRRA